MHLQSLLVTLAALTATSTAFPAVATDQVNAKPHDHEHSRQGPDVMNHGLNPEHKHLTPYPNHAKSNENFAKRDPYFWDHGHYWPGIMGPHADDVVGGKENENENGRGSVARRDAGPEPEPYFWDHGHYWPGIMGPHAEVDDEGRGNGDGKGGVEKRAEDVDDGDGGEGEEFVDVNGLPVLKDTVFYGY